MSERRYEGIVTRAIAFAIDAAAINLVAVGVAGTVALGLSILTVPDTVDTVLLAVGGVLFVIWSAGYFVFFWSTTGQTPGSRMMRIMVCRADAGELLRPRVAALRVIYMTLAAIPLLAGFLTILVDDRRRGVHDMLAGTVVVEAVDVIVPEPVTSRPTAAPVDARPAPASTDVPPTPSASASRSM